MTMPRKDQQLTDKQIGARRDELAKRILRTPPLPRDAYKIGKPKPSKAESPAKRTSGKGRVRVGKSKS